MMRNIFLLSLALAITGCASVKISHEGDRTMAVVENSGWYFLNFIPLASGNPQYPNQITCRPFVGTVKLKNNMQLLDIAMRQTHAIGVKDLTSYYTDEHVFFILLKRHVLHTSAELIINQVTVSPLIAEANSDEPLCALQNQ